MRRHFHTMTRILPAVLLVLACACPFPAYALEEQPDDTAGFSQDTGNGTDAGDRPEEWAGETAGGEVTSGGASETNVPVISVPIPECGFTLSVNGEVTLCRGQSMAVNVLSIDKREHVSEWFSYDSGLCAVEDGILYASGERTGSTTVVARTIGPFPPRNASFRVNVVSKAKAPVRPSLSNVPKKIVLRLHGSKKKRKYRLRIAASPVVPGSKIRYKSLNPKIATVSKKGVVTAKRRGRTWIVIKYRGIKKKVRVRVN